MRACMCGHTRVQEQAHVCVHACAGTLKEHSSWLLSAHGTVRVCVAWLELLVGREEREGVAELAVQVESVLRGIFSLWVHWVWQYGRLTSNNMSCGLPTRGSPRPLNNIAPIERRFLNLIHSTALRGCCSGKGGYKKHMRC